MSRVFGRVVLAGALMCLLAAGGSAQQTTTATETKTFEVISVDGNHLVVKMPEGTREITVPDDFRFTVDGQPMSVHDMKPGMKGTANITTKTTVTPVTVTEVKNGTVLHTTGSSIMVRTDEGVKSFTQDDINKRGVKIMREGKPASISDFRDGDRLTATIVTSKPPRVVSEKEVQATLAQGGAAAPAPAKPAPQAPQPTATAGQAPAPQPAQPAPKQLPRTGSPLPLLALAGLVSLMTAAALTARRRRLPR